MKDKEKPVAELDDLEWDRDLAFIVDITEHLHVLHAKIQGRNRVMTEYYRCIHTFRMKLDQWVIQLPPR